MLDFDCNDRDIKTLIKFSKIIGNDIPFSTQGAGSNFSLKLNDFLIIKGSGKRLDSLDSINDFSIIKYSIFRQKMSAIIDRTNTLDEKENEYAKLVSSSSLNNVRPSMETGFHALFPQKFIFHFHSLFAIILGEWLSQNPDKIDDVKIIGQKFHLHNLQIIPYITPGLQIANEINFSQKSNLIILKNHGVILTMDHPENDFSNWNKFEKEICEKYLQNFYLQKLSYQDDTSIGESVNFAGKFPDYALYVDKYLEIYNFDKENFKKNIRSEKNLLEIWQANHFLQQSKIRIPTLDISCISAINQNKLEKFRK